MPAHKRSRKGPPKTFSSVREAKAALSYLADSLANHSFSWPAAAIRSYLAGGSPSLDEAFGLTLPVAKEKEPQARTSRPAKTKVIAKAGSKKRAV